MLAFADLCVREYFYHIIPTGPRVCWNEFNLGAPGGNKSIQQRSLSFTHSRRARFLTHCERARVEWQQLRALTTNLYMNIDAPAPSMLGASATPYTGGVLRRYAPRRRSSNSNGRAITQKCSAIPHSPAHHRRRRQQAFEKQHWGGKINTPVAGEWIGIWSNTYVAPVCCYFLIKLIKSR